MLGLYRSTALQRVARPAARRRPSRADADVSRRHHERPGLLHQQRRVAGGETTIRQTRFDHRHAHRLAHAPCGAVCRHIDRALAMLERPTTACTRTNGCWAISRPTRSPCSSWARSTANSGAAARTSGPAGPKAFTSAATTCATWACARRRSPVWPIGRQTSMFQPQYRDRQWMRLFEEHRGQIGEGFGFLAFTTRADRRLFKSCDAKFTTSTLAKQLKTLALFGPPMGRTWDPNVASSRPQNDEHQAAGGQRLDPTDSPSPAIEPASKAVDLAKSRTKRRRQGPRREEREPKLARRPGAGRCCPRGTRTSGWRPLCRL